MPAPTERSVCSARARPSTTGSAASRWLGFGTIVTSISPAGVTRVPDAGRWYLTSPVPPSGIDDERVDRALALELAQDRLVRAADGVHERVEPAAVGHSDHDLVRAACRGEPDRLVEHRHERLETLERELLLPEERPPQVLLEALGLGEPVQERASAPPGSSGCRKRPDSIACLSQTRSAWSEMCSIS